MYCSAAQCFAMCTAQGMLLSNAVQQSDLQFALCKQYYKELQCHTRNLQLAISQVLQCNICDIKFTVQFTLYGTEVIQICNLVAFGQKRRTSFFFKQKESHFLPFSGMAEQCLPYWKI